jgi:hypothetical protein
LCSEFHGQSRDFQEIKQNMNKLFREIYKNDVHLPTQANSILPSLSSKHIDFVSEPNKANRILLLLHLLQTFGFHLVSFELPGSWSKIPDTDPRFRGFQEDKLFNLAKECLNQTTTTLLSSKVRSKAVKVLFSIPL